MNAKQELVDALEALGVSDKKITCAIVRLETIHFQAGKKITLKVNHSESEYAEFLESLDFEYDDLYEDIRGTIWFEGGTWLSKDDDPNWEGWVCYRTPNIPMECFPSDL